MAWTRTAICAIGSVFLAGACRSNDEPPRPELSPRKLSAPVATPSASPADAGDQWVRRKLMELRDRTLKWTPRDAPERHMTFAGDRLLVLLGTDIVVIDVTGKSDVVRHSVGELQQLIPLPDSSVLALGVKSTLRIRPGAKSPETLGCLLVFPQSLVFGSASDARRIDVIDVTSGQVVSYGPQERPSFSSLWLPDVTLYTPELKQAHCAQLLDGTYGCFAHDQLWHLNPRSRPKSVGKIGVGLPVWRVLAAAHADQLWLARDNGQLERWWFGPPPKKLASVQLPWTPYDVSLKRDTVSVIRIVQERSKPKEVTLVVLDTEGHTRFERSLMPTSDEDVNLAEQELKQAEVVVHPKRPWVAVRTSQGVRVLDANSGETLIESR